MHAKINEFCSNSNVFRHYCSPCKFLQALTFVEVTGYNDSYPALGYHKYFSKTLNSDWSFGLCVKPDLGALERLVWSYFTPLYMTILVILSLKLGELRRFMKIFGRSQCIHMLWEFILLTFSSLVSSSFGLLECVRLRSDGYETPLTRYRRFANDPSFECFRGYHLPWGIVAVIVAAACALFVVALPFLHRYHRLMPFSDVYSSVYSGKRRWWCAVDLLRRVVLAAIFSSVDDPHRQHLAILVTCCVLLGAQALAWPFKTWHANASETIFLFSLVLIAVLNTPDKTWGYSLAIEFLFFIPAVVLVGSICFEQIKIRRSPDKVGNLFSKGSPLSLLKSLRGSSTPLKSSLLDDEARPTTAVWRATSPFAIAQFFFEPWKTWEQGTSSAPGWAPYFLLSHFPNLKRSFSIFFFFWTESTRSSPFSPVPSHF